MEKESAAYSGAVKPAALCLPKRLTTARGLAPKAALVQDYDAIVASWRQRDEDRARSWAESIGTLRGREQATKILSNPAPEAGFFMQPLRLGPGHIEVTSECGLLGFEVFYKEDISRPSGVPDQAGN